MIITEELIAKLANLSRMALTKEESKTFQKQLDDILTFFEKLQEVDTSDVEPVSQITGLKNVARIDEVVECNIADSLLECSPLGVEKGHIRVQKAI